MSSGFYGVPNLWTPPVGPGTMPPRPREPRACHICGVPLPLIRHPNMSVCPPSKGESESECQSENRRRITERGNARRKKRKAALKEEAVSE